MSLLDQEYTEKGSDNVGGGSPTAKILDLTISRVEEATSKAGTKYISVDYAYKDDSGEWRYIKFNSFNPAKSEGGKQLWVNLLTVCGVKKGSELMKKSFKAVVYPVEYEKRDGGVGVSLKVFKNYLFTKEGLSPSGDAEKMAERLAEAIEHGVEKLTITNPVKATTENSDSMPF